MEKWLNDKKLVWRQVYYVLFGLCIIIAVIYVCSVCWTITLLVISLTVYCLSSHCLFQVDFNALQIETLAEQVRQREQERRQNLINEEKLKKVTAEINGLYYISSSIDMK